MPNVAESTAGRRDPVAEELVVNGAHAVRYSDASGAGGTRTRDRGIMSPPVSMAQAVYQALRSQRGPLQGP
jgi:hypothetical protein